MSNRDLVTKHIQMMPHCDSRVLHAPEDGCKYCNAHPEWQALRVAWNIAFTGHSLDKNGKPVVGDFGVPVQPCPAEAERGMESINGWHGNVPMTPEAEKVLDDHFAKLHEDLSKYGF